MILHIQYQHFPKVIPPDPYKSTLVLGPIYQFLFGLLAFQLFLFTQRLLALTSLIELRHVVDGPICLLVQNKQ